MKMWSQLSAYLVLVAWTSTVAVAQPTCSPNCRCSNPDAVTCAYTASIPTAIPANVTKLTLTGVRFTEIPADALAAFPTLQEFKIDRQSSNSPGPLIIRPNAFRGFKGRVITITNVNLSTLGMHSMSGIKNVSTLDLHNCKIDVIEPGAFDGSSGIATLTLGDNPLTQVSPGAFSGLSKVSNLIMTRSQISVIKSNMFRGFDVQLIYLSYSSSLTKIEEKAFLGMDTLRMVTFEKSAITVIEPRAFEGLGVQSGLHVNLRDNKIRTLPCSTFDRMSGLVDFDFSNNPFSCDCRLSWVMEETDSHHLSTIKCNTPQGLFSQSLSDLNIGQLSCRRFTKKQGCSDKDKMRNSNVVAYDINITSQRSRPVKESGTTGSSGSLRSSLLLVPCFAVLKLVV